MCHATCDKKQTQKTLSPPRIRLTRKCVTRHVTKNEHKKRPHRRGSASDENVLRDICRIRRSWSLTVSSSAPSAPRAPVHHRWKHGTSSFPSGDVEMEDEDVPPPPSTFDRGQTQTGGYGAAQELASQTPEEHCGSSHEESVLPPCFYTDSSCEDPQCSCVRVACRPPSASTRIPVDPHLLPLTRIVEVEVARVRWTLVGRIGWTFSSRATW